MLTMLKVHVYVYNQMHDIERIMIREIIDSTVAMYIWMSSNHINVHVELFNLVSEKTKSS